jgi:hypothetical protein
MDDGDIERMMDIIGDGDLTAVAREQLHREGLWPLMRACVKRPTQPLCPVTWVTVKPSERHQAALSESADPDPQAIELTWISQNFSDRRARAAHSDERSLAKYRRQ